MRRSCFPVAGVQSRYRSVRSERGGDDAGRWFRILLCRQRLATSSPPLRRATRAVLLLEFQPLVDAQPRCQRRACLADSRPLRRRQLPDVPLGPRSARVTWGHSLPCRSAPGASAAATAAPRFSEPLAARVSTQTTAALLSVPMAAPIL